MGKLRVHVVADDEGQPLLVTTDRRAVTVAISSGLEQLEEHLTWLQSFARSDLPPACRRGVEDHVVGLVSKLLQLERGLKAEREQEE